MTVSYLSEQGRRRRDDMRIRLQAAVVRRRRQRRGTGAGLALVGLLALLTGLGWLGGRGSPAAGPAGPGDPQAPPRYACIDVEVVRGTSSRVADWVVRGGDASRFYVNDDGLADLLVEAQLEPGFIRVGSEVTLLAALPEEPDPDTPDGDQRGTGR